MAGISGIVHLDRKNCSVEDFPLMKKMCESIRHRGNGEVQYIGLRTDDKTEYLFGGINENIGIFGYNKLHLSNCEKKENEGIIFADKTVCVLFDGEIYNRNELKSIISDNSMNEDSQLLASLYLKFGLEKTIRLIDGVFSIAFVDTVRKEIHLVRDYMGTRPLYYAVIDRCLYFSSELKAFIGIPGFSRSVNTTALTERLMYNHTVMPSLLDGVEQVMDGCALSFNYATGYNSELTYFDINSYERNNKYKSFEEAKVATQELLKKCIKKRIDQSRIGCQLSGGIDSSMIAYYLSTEFDKKDVYSIVFEDEKISEKRYIDKVVDACALSSKQFVLKPEDIIGNFEELVWSSDAFPSVINANAIFHLAQRTKGQVDIIFTGDASDEILAGYGRFVKARYVSAYNSNKLLKKIAVSSGINAKIVSYGESDLDKYIIQAGMEYNPKAVEELCPLSDYSKVVNDRLDLLHSFSGNLFDRQRKYFMKTYLFGALERQRIWTYHSISTRSPFMDKEFIENSFEIPMNYLIHNIPEMKAYPNIMFTTKYLLKEMCCEKFGRKFAYRKKNGLKMPVNEFFFHPKMQEYLNDLIIPGMLNRGIFDRKKIEKYLCSSGHIEHIPYGLLWKACSFEVWCQQYLDGRDMIK